MRLNFEHNSTERSALSSDKAISLLAILLRKWHSRICRFFSDSDTVFLQIKQCASVLPMVVKSQSNSRGDGMTTLVAFLPNPVGRQLSAYLVSAK